MDGLSHWRWSMASGPQIAAKHQQANHHDQRRHQAGQKHGVDGHAGNDGVHDQGHRWGQQNAQSTGTGHQTDAALLWVSSVAQQRQQQAPQGQNGHPTAPSEGGEK